MDSRKKTFLNRFSGKQIALTMIVILSFLLFLILTVWSEQMVKGLDSQQAAARWDAEGKSAQVSCFFSEQITVDEMQLMNFEKELEKSLKGVLSQEEYSEENNRRLIVDAYSAMGTITIFSEKGKMEVNAVGIGGDFYLFHPLQLISGGYFSGDDLMKDSVILDEEAAWQLFGSSDIVGQSVMIGNVPHYIQGVIKREEGRFAESAGLNQTVAYVSLESLEAYGNGDGISTYEIIAPDPVEKYVYNAVKEKLGVKETDMIVVENSSRYTVKALIPVILDFGTRSMQHTAVRFPYWENIARGWEDVKALVLVLQFVFLLLPGVIIVGFLIIKWKNRTFTWKDIRRGIMKKRIISGIVLMILVLGFTGCKGKDREEAIEQAKEHVYQMEEIQFSEEENSNSISQMLKIGGSVYAYGYVWSEDGGSCSIHFYEIKEDGSIGNQYQIQTEQDVSYNDFVASEDGNLYCVKNKFSPSEENPEKYIDEYYFSKITLDGETLFEIKLNDLPQIQKLYEEAGYFNAYNMFTSKDSVYISCMGTFCEFDKEGNFLSVVKEPEGKNVLEGANIVPLDDGRIAASVYGENGITISLLDMETGTIGEEFKLPGTSYDYSFYPGVGYDLYLVDSYGLYGYNIGDQERTQLLSYIDSDFGFYRIGSVIPVNEKEFLATYDDMESGRTQIAKFSKVDPSEVKEKEIITLAMAYSDWTIRMKVIDFNKTNETYRINLQDYSAMYATDEDYSAGLTRLNTDIASGKVPDIILIDSSMPMESYIGKGLFEDLLPYIENDSEMSVDQFMPNIIEAFSTEGKLYSLVPHYNIQTLLAKSSIVGAERGWTVQEAAEIWAAQPKGTEFLTGIDREYMYEYVRKSVY